MTFGDDLAVIVATLSYWADQGDEKAALDLNRLVAASPPEIVRAAHRVGPNVNKPPCADWEMLGATVDLIAAHYGLPELSVWSAVFELERAVLAETCCGSLATLLQSPNGLSYFGARVAQGLLGPAADATPPLGLVRH